MEPKVVVILLNWNSFEVTNMCIQSLLKTNYQNFEILVIDNDSKDDSLDRLRISFPDIIIIDNPSNDGFAKGNNIGIEFAFGELEADHIVLLNNDTIVDPDWLITLLDVLRTFPDVGAVGSKIFYFDQSNTIWSAGGSINIWRGIPKLNRHNEVDSGSDEPPYEVDYATGCSLLISRNAFQTVGPLDPDYFLYFEETDWCSRARQCGYKIMIAPRSRVWHKVGYSTGSVDSSLHLYYMIRNNYIYIAKNNSNHLIRYIKLFVFVSIVLKRYLVGYVLGDDKSRRISLAVSQGLIDAVLGRTGQTTRHLAYTELPSKAY